MFYRLPLLVIFILLSACSQNGRQIDFFSSGKKGGETGIVVLLLDNTTFSSARILDTAFAKAAPRADLTQGADSQSRPLSQRLFLGADRREPRQRRHPVCF